MANTHNHAQHLTVETQRWLLKEPFVISRGVKTAADVIVVCISDGKHKGFGEAVPYARYGETVEGVIKAIKPFQENIPNRNDLEDLLPAGAARNALDCALWDLEAKQSGVSPLAQADVDVNLGLDHLQPRQTAFTLSLSSAEAMAQAAGRVPQHTCLKLKLGGAGDDARMLAVRRARPDAELIGDANEAWTDANVSMLLAAAAQSNMALIEQPLPAGQDTILADIERPVPVCADESAHTSKDLKPLRNRYDAINIKLDKTGGLTEALTMLSRARALGFDVMVGCMVATSLAMAPAFFLAQHARWVDLDGPLLLAEDRPHGFRIINGVIAPPSPKLWG
ncbi:MAG: N-acetyl-D-Glu racemase DgcA [Hyphomicrobiaceae bacterium]